VGPVTFTIPCGTNEATLEGILESMPSIVRGVKVARAGNGGPGMVWTITFYDYGNRGTLTLGSIAGITAGTATTSIAVGDVLVDVFTLFEVSLFRRFVCFQCHICFDLGHVHLWHLEFGVSWAYVRVVIHCSHRSRGAS
jgi:hypothetical protein